MSFLRLRLCALSSWVSVWNRTPHLCESLEPRRMLFVNVDGTDGPDMIEVAYVPADLRFHITVNGVETTVLDQVHVRALGGDDTIRVQSTNPGNRLVIYGGSGNDVVSNPNHNLAQTYAGTDPFFGCEFIGESGVDTLIADNSADTEIVQIDIFNFGISRRDSQGPDLATPELESVERVNYIDSNFGNPIEVHPGIEQVTVDGAGGNDQIVATGALLSSANQTMSIDGGAGSDLFALEDSFQLNSVDYKITANTVEKYVGRVLTYGGFESFDLVCTSSFDQITLLSKPAAMSMTIDAGGADDVVIVGGGDLDGSGLFAGNVTLSGGLDSDLIRFDDHLDSDAAGETEAYTFDNFTLAKGSAQLIYGSFESQTLDVANGIIAGFNTVPVINLNALSGQIESTTINGGSDRGMIVNLGNGNAAVSNNITLKFGEGIADFNINDQSATVARNFSLSANQLTSPVTVNFSGADNVNLNAGPMNDNISITGSAPGTAVVAHGNLGNDFVSIGGGDFDNMLSPVTVTGNGGMDVIRFDALQDPDLFTGTLRNNSFATGGLTHSYTTFETVNVRAGTGGSDVTIQSVPFLTLPAISTTVFSGGSGADLVTIGTGNVGVPGNVTVTGAGGSDTLVLDDSTSGGAASYTFDPGNRFFKGSGVVSIVATVEKQILLANNNSNTITVNSVNAELTVMGNAGNDSVIVLDSSDPVTVNTGSETASATAPFGDSIEINSDFGVSGDAPATVLIDQDDTVLGLNVSQQGTLRIAGGAVLDKSAGSGSFFSLTGTLDLAGGSFLSRAGGPTLATFQGLLTHGSSGGAWNGTSPSGSINSSLAASSPLSDGVGYGLGSQVPPTIGSFTIGLNDTLVRYTLAGDSDLDLDVDLSDLGNMASHFGATSGSIWSQGNFDYDDDVDLPDLGTLATTFGMNLSGQLRRESTWVGERTR